MPFALDARATALPRSLALSSLSYLTLVVLLLFARTLFHAPQAPIVDWRPVDIPSHDPIPTPLPPGVVPPPVHPTVIPDVPTFQPTDEPVTDALPQVASPTQPTVADGTGSGTATGPGNPGPGGGGPPTDQPIPEPGTFEYTETLPVLVHKVQPAYPDIARQAGMDGQVTLWLRVGTDGRVRDVRIEGKPSLFDDEAGKAARQFVFTPATTDGHPVAVWVRMAIKFVLRD